MIELTLKKLLKKEDLTIQEAQSAMTDIMKGNFFFNKTCRLAYCTPHER